MTNGVDARAAYNKVRSTNSDLLVALISLKNQIPDSDFKRRLKTAINTIRNEIDKLEEVLPTGQR